MPLALFQHYSPLSTRAGSSSPLPFVTSLPANARRLEYLLMRGPTSRASSSRTVLLMYTLCHHRHLAVPPPRVTPPYIPTAPLSRRRHPIPIVMLPPIRTVRHPCTLGHQRGSCTLISLPLITVMGSGGAIRCKAKLIRIPILHSHILKYRHTLNHFHIPSRGESNVHLIHFVRTRRKGQIAGVQDGQVPLQRMDGAAWACFPASDSDSSP